MEDAVRKVSNWASHGTLRQFHTELVARLSDDYEVEINGDKLVCYSVRKEGGFLGIGAKKIRETVLVAETGEDGIVALDIDASDPDFIEYLAPRLKQH